MTPGHMIDVILVTMMTAEVAVVTTTIVVADGTMTVPEIMTEEVVIAIVTAVVMVEIGMMTGDTR